MERAFESHLDTLLNSSKNLSAHEALFASNLKAHLHNALYQVSASDHCIVLAETALSEGHALLRAHEGWMFRKDDAGEVAARQRFSEAIEALREEMRACPASAVAKALGIE